MIKNKFVRNDFEFTPLSVPRYNTLILKGDIRGRMPDFKHAIEQGYKIGNLRDLNKRRMEKYNSDENDRYILNNTHVTLIGNPAVGNPDRSGEQFIINDLEQKVFANLKSKILSMNSSTYLNYCWALPLAQSDEESKEIYEQIKREGKPYITVLSHEHVKALMYINYSLPDVRMQLLEGLFQGKLDERDEFIKHAKIMKGANDISNILGFSPDVFTNVKFIWSDSVNGFYDCGNNAIRCHTGRLLGVGSSAVDAQADKKRRNFMSFFS